MSSRWRILDLTTYSGVIDVARGRLVIQGSEQPLTDFACILTGAATQWTGNFVDICAAFDVPIMHCDWRGIPRSATISWADNTRIASRHLAQAKLSEPRKKNAWMRIVRSKVKGQANNLTENSAAQQRLVSLSRQVKSGDPENIEAQAARTYWNSLWPDEQFTRIKEGDGRNALLNYGYGVLRGNVIRSILITGLIPALGIHHRSRSNMFALADDFIEPFRPCVDYKVMELETEATLQDKYVKAHLVSVLEETMSTSGYSVSTMILELAQRFARYIEGETEVLEVPIWSGKRG